MAPSTVTRLIRQARSGDTAALQALWERYATRLIELARRKLQGRRRRAADEEDVALSAFHSLAQGLERGRFTTLGDKDDLWKLLIVITHRKARRLVEHERRLKRGAGRVVGESVIEHGVGSSSTGKGLVQLVSREPTPEFAALLAEQFADRMAALPDDQFRRLAELKFQGYENEEIAGQLQCSLRSVERKLSLIRKLWKGSDAS